MAATAQDPETRLQHALDLAYGYLGRRDRTVLEVRRHLERARVEPATIEAALDALAEQGYLDDARYARLFTEDRRRLDGWGAERIARRLAQAGVAEDLIAEATGDREHADELDAAVLVLERRMARPPADARERERALGLLVRRGYELELAYDAVRRFERG